ncbi:MAG: nickel pincer cofactor biosynthesis protein LarC [Actinobacteria bacterium]|nr:nickel pincer cofactor biosynthesis protein LarC [Actinomycetota bacterium]
MGMAYFDCFSGISGDMTVGALIDLGAPLDRIERELAKIALPAFEIMAEPVTRGAIAATRFTVRAEEKGIVRTWTNIRELVEESELDDDVKARAIDIFRRLAEAEAKVHRKTLETVHFHEVGATDAIVDVVSASVALKALGIEEVRSSPVATGFGVVKTEHGLIPLPAPAVAEILVGAPLYSANVQAELVTPTGAAILASATTSFGEMPMVELEGVGYGAGARELDLPNVLRVFLGKLVSPLEEVSLVETTLDTADGELLSFMMERLFEAGAVDAWFTPVYMKKGRPGVIVSALTSSGKEEALASAMLDEGSTLGVRYSRSRRIVAQREVIMVKTAWGDARVKAGRYRGKIISTRPEFDDCRAIALKSGLPLDRVRRLVTDEARKSLGLT